MQQQLFEKFAAYVEARFGIRLPDEKKTLLETRLFKLFSSSQEPELADEESFFAYLCQDQSGRADNILADAITTNHTFFMREKDHFAYFSEAVLPYWAEHSPERDLRTWCAACSTGEEAYTLAMLIQDFFALKTGWDVSLLATDLSREALAAARSGSLLGADMEPETSSRKTRLWGGASRRSTERARRPSATSRCPGCQGQGPSSPTSDSGCSPSGSG